MWSLNPSLLFQPVPRAQKMLALELLFLAQTPSLNCADRDLRILARLRFSAPDPMQRAEKFQPERVFKTFDQLGDTIHPRQRFGVFAEKGTRLLDCARKEMNRRVWLVPAVAVTLGVMGLQTNQPLPKIRRVRPERLRLVVELQRLSRLLHEVHQLMNLKQADEGIEQSFEVSIHDKDERRSAHRHVWALGSIRHRFRLRRATRRINENADIGQLLHRGFDARTPVAPVETTVAATKRRNRDRANAETLDRRHEVLQTGLDVFDMAGGSPMPFRRKVDDPAWPADQAAEIEDVHFAELHLFGLAGGLVRAEHCRIRLLELPRDAAAHHSRSVHRVHQRFDWCLHQIAR